MTDCDATPNEPKAPKRASARKKLTDEQVDAIFRLVTQGVPYREVAKRVGCHYNSVGPNYHARRAELRTERDAAGMDDLAQQLARLEMNYVDATEALERAKRLGEDARIPALLAAQVKALDAMANLTGTKAASKVEHSGDVPVTVLRIVEEITPKEV